VKKSILLFMTNIDGERVYDLLTKVRDHLLTALVRKSFASFGAKSVICSPARLVDLNSVSIGEGVYLGSGSWLQGSKASFGGVTLRIGNRVSVSGTLNASAQLSVVIGDDVLIGRDVLISDHTHRFDLAGPVKNQGSTSAKGVSIGNGAWLGQGVVIAPGVSVGEGAVVGAYSFVNSDIPARAVAVGSPARILKVLS
jgi:UDP-3-O-[3-hydroxymyristoyl] glucosamine N-acyltransferase